MVSKISYNDPWKDMDICQDFDDSCSKCPTLDLCWNATIIDQRINLSRQT